MGLAVGGDTRRGGRVQHLPHRVGQLVQADVQDGLVLAGKRRAGKVLGGGGGADREPLVRAAELGGGAAQPCVCLVPVGGGGRGHHHSRGHWEAGPGQARQAGRLGAQQGPRLGGVKVGGLGEAEDRGERRRLDLAGRRLGLGLVGHHACSRAFDVGCWWWPSPGVMARSHIPTSSSTTPSRGRATPWPAPDWDVGRGLHEQVHHDRAGQGLHRQDRVHPAQAAGGHLLVQVAGHQRQGAHRLGRILVGVGAAVVVGIAAGDLEQQLQQQADVAVHGGGHCLGDGGDDLGRGPIAHGLQHGRDRLEGREASDQLGKQRLLAGNQPVQGGAGDAGGGGELVHGQLGQAVAADQLQGGVEDAAANGRWRLEAELVEQLLLVAEQSVQGGAGDAGSGGQLVHRQTGQPVLVLAFPGCRSFVGGHGWGEGRQDLLLGGCWHGHEMILDEMYRLVQYRTHARGPPASRASARGQGRSSTVI